MEDDSIQINLLLAHSLSIFKFIVDLRGIFILHNTNFTAQF